MFAIYKRSLSQRPFLTQALTAGTLFAIGDGVAQHVFEPPTLAKNKHNYHRTLRMAVYGTLVAGPTTFAWYKFLDRVVKVKQPVAALVARVGLDQFLFAPAFLAIFLTYQASTDRLMPVSADVIKEQNMSLMEDLKYRMNRDYVQVLKANYFVWPWIQLVNFWFVPLNYRLGVVNLVAIGWNGYLSLVSNK